MNRRSFNLGGLAVALLAITGGCTYYGGYPGYRPPPYAPAHGYRYRHPYGVDLVYDSGIAVYIVLGRPRHYFHRHHFYRYRSRKWYRSPRLDGRWHRVPRDHLPPGLRRKRWD